MNDDRQAGSAKEVDHVKCGCDEYPECTHALYWYQGFKAGETWARGGGEWTALRELAAKWLELADSAECYAEEAKRHSYPPEKIESHARTARTLKKCAADLEALAAAAPAPPQQVTEEQIIGFMDRWYRRDGGAPVGTSLWKWIADQVNAMPPPQDGQGAELPHKWTCGNSDHACNLRGYCVNTNCSEFSGPPRGGSSSDLADPKNLKVGDEVTLKGKITCVNESPLWYGVQFKPANARFPYNLMCYPNDIETSPSKAEREVASATDGLSGAEGHRLRRSDRTGWWFGRCSCGDDFEFEREWTEHEALHAEAPHGLSEAVAGNASAPVGEPRGRCPECAVADQLQCVLDKGHENGCMFAEWPYRAREVGEGLREAKLQTLAYNLYDKVLEMENPWDPELQCRGGHRLCDYSDEAVEQCLATVIEMLRAAVLAAPAPKPVGEVDFTDPVQAKAWNAGFELAHELQPCGHSRGDCRDAKYVTGVSTECESRCIGCEREASLKEAIARLSAAKPAPPAELTVEQIHEALRRAAERKPPR